MRTISYKRYIAIGGVIFLLLSLPSFYVEGIRSRVVALLSFFQKERVISLEEQEMGGLEAENHLLRVEVSKLRAMVEQNRVLELFHQELKRDLPPKRYEEGNFLLGLQVEAVPARVIFRDPASWSSSLWISVGEETNLRLGKHIIKKNSPVVVGRAAIGVVDYVGKKQSRVRLITDMGLKPSVRAVRGSSQNVFLAEHIETLLRHLYSRSDLHLNPQNQGVLIQQLETLKKNLLQESDNCFLAKGIIQGAGTPLWRSSNHLLKGIGFNYDFPDEEGPARELISGKTIPASNSPAMPLLKVSDLLVTTGMDGVFPPGLRVAEVTKVFPLREGAYTYEIEAVPIVGNLDSLQTLFILPPIGFDPEENSSFPYMP